jgi:hypothetical protein
MGGLALDQTAPTQLTVLHDVVKGGDPITSRKLVELGASPTIGDADGINSVQFAARSGYDDVLKALLCALANRDAHAGSVRTAGGESATAVVEVGRSVGFPLFLWFPAVCAFYLSPHLIGCAFPWMG